MSFRIVLPYPVKTGTAFSNITLDNGELILSPAHAPKALWVDDIIAKFRCLIKILPGGYQILKVS
jgi:hypothetical protein